MLSHSILSLVLKTWFKPITHALSSPHLVSITPSTRHGHVVTAATRFITSFDVFHDSPLLFCEWTHRDSHTPWGLCGYHPNIHWASSLKCDVCTVNSTFSEIKVIIFHISPYSSLLFVSNRPKRSFRFFQKTLQKNLNDLFGQPNISYLSINMPPM